MGQIRSKPNNEAPLPLTMASLHVYAKVYAIKSLSEAKKPKRNYKRPPPVVTFPVVPAELINPVCFRCGEPAVNTCSYQFCWDKGCGKRICRKCTAKTILGGCCCVECNESLKSSDQVQYSADRFMWRRIWKQKQTATRISLNLRQKLQVEHEFFECSDKNQ